MTFRRELTLDQIKRDDPKREAARREDAMSLLLGLDSYEFEIYLATATAEEVAVTEAYIEAAVDEMLADEEDAYLLFTTKQG